MSDIVLFSIGFVLFILVTWAILLFGYARFNQLYSTDRIRTAVTATPAVIETRTGMVTYNTPPPDLRKGNS
jgi:hypothetical protein